MKLIPVCTLLSLYNRFEEELGCGQFGTVYKALWKFPVDLIPQESNSSDTQTNEVKVANVAVKVMDNQTTQEDRISFLQEAVLLGQFTDPNVVAIFGIVTMTSRVSLGVYHMYPL